MGLSRTRVVNLRHANYTVYIGRPGHGQAGPWGNPILPYEPCLVCGQLHPREGTIPCFETWFRVQVEADPELRDRAISALMSQVLGCFCTPRACHGDVYVRWLDEIVSMGLAIPRRQV